ncbi:MAG: tetratricopeptide repeat protein [Leptolyngbya sp. UWPOB_LEPTO1]|uniref:tetratricopeptide repeat protein n=1 Tax=Leptolyngbya sp. UWPOB_LEPTO1 TaxID=2815653 RepID=UPI001AD16940|nr:toll/interleukin-1 receptor domain-containing protein [Leptolyngbya sp. UWPOB_LEPTO1]MBN8560827.1 tetratricopeptide repeat protein [Leptolyngbya sp. UWPOB_LEPTO1]
MPDETQTTPSRPVIFICYAHKDNDDAEVRKRCLDLLLMHLAPLQFDHDVLIWCDRALQIGDEWNPEILANLQSAKVAIALLSPAFFASSYIRAKEVPMILEQQDKGQTTLLPIMLSPCLVAESQFRYVDRNGEEKKRSLNDFQASNDMKRPLKGLPEHEQDAILLRVAQRVRGIITGKKPDVPIGGELQNNTPDNLPRSTTDFFVGRAEALSDIHKRFQAGQRLAICAVLGMGGIGKTELALRYALQYWKTGRDRGAICWLNARKGVDIEIVRFTRVCLDLTPPEFPDSESLVGWCWRQFPADESLIVFDNVQDYQEIAAFLPPDESRFKVLITTRSQIDQAGVERLSIETLNPLAAYQLLYQTVNDDRRLLEGQTIAEKLCEWLGYLPLGIQLVAKFLKLEPDLSLAELWAELEAEALKHDGLSANAKRGESIELVFELSWEKLSEAERQLAMLLGTFAAAPMQWSWVEGAIEFCRVKAPEQRGWERLKFWKARSQVPQQWCLLLEPKAIDLGRRRLIELSLLQRVGERQHQVHPLLREFFAQKMTREERKQIQSAVAQVMIGIAKQIPQSPTLEMIGAVTPAIPHLQAVAEDLMKLKSREECGIADDDDLTWVCIGIGRFYQGQGLYADAEPWFDAGLTVARTLLGEQHPAVATSLNNVAGLYRSQGRYEEAEPLYIQALELMRTLLGEQHPAVATSLNNLALLYKSQGRYEEAEPLYIQALELRRSLLGEQHPAVATSLNNLALLYESQGRYELAEPLYIQAFQIDQQALGQEHPDFAIDLSNLAGLYTTLERYAEAEPLYLQAIAIFYDRLGEAHPYTQQAWQGFIGFLVQVLQSERASELSDDPMTRSLLQQLQSASE